MQITDSLDHAMRGDELQQFAGPGRATREGEHAAQHQAVGGDQIERAEPEEDADAERHQADGDVVRQDADRQHGGGRDIEQALGPQLAALHAVDGVFAGEQRDQLGDARRSATTGAGAEHE